MSCDESPAPPPTSPPSPAVLQILAELARVRAALNGSAEALQELERKLRHFAAGKAL